MAAFNNISDLLSTLPNEEGAREFLSSLDWPRGLQQIFIRNLKKIPIRFFLCDDSGSVSFWNFILSCVIILFIFL